MPTPWTWANVDTVGIAFPLILALVLVAIPAFAVARLLTRRCSSYRAGVVRATGRLPERAASPRPLKTRYVLLLVVASAVLFWAYTPRQKPPHGPRPGPVPAKDTTWIPLGFAAAAVGGLIAFAVFRNRDPQLIQGAERAQAGDLDGAIAMLRGAMGAKPTAHRAHHLACYLMAKQDWPEAYKRLLEAEALGLNARFYRGHMALALRNLGRPEDAIAVLEPHVTTDDANLIDVCHYCDALLDVNRLASAWDQIYRAEAILGKTAAPDDATARQWRAMIDACRVRYEERTGGKKGPPPDEF